MRLFAYTIYDVCSGVYDRPFYMHSDASAVRSFRDQVENPESYIGKHPEDFTLMSVGTWEDSEGELVGAEPKKVTTGLEQLSELRKVDPVKLATFDDKVNGLGESYGGTTDA